MADDQSFGIIPVKRADEGWKFLLIQHHRSLFWGFPKGHLEKEETPKEAAEREFHEETALTVQKYLSDEPLIEKYVFTHEGEKIFKTVTYFLAEVTGTVQIQEKELRDFRWVSAEEGVELATYPEGKNLLKRAWELIRL